MEDLFSNTKVKDIVTGEGPMVTVDNTESIESALKKLVQHNVYSVPIVEKASGKPLGLLGLVDLLTHLVGLFLAKANITPGNRKQTVDAFAQHAFQRNDLNEIKATFFSETAVNVMDASKQNKFQPMPPDATLRDIIKVLQQRELARVPIVDSSGKVVKMVSQSAVISFLSKHLDKIAEKANLTIDQAQVGTRPLISIPLEFRAIDAFVMMIEYHLSALCFLGEEGEVSGNISVKDLKGVLLDFNALIHPVADYVNMIRRDNVRDIFPLVNVHTTDTVGKAIAKLAAGTPNNVQTESNEKEQRPE